MSDMNKKSFNINNDIYDNKRCISAIIKNTIRKNTKKIDTKRPLPTILDIDDNTKLPKKINCKYDYHILQRDFECGGIIITKPGHYKFCSNITFKPDDEFQVAIVIASSNVVLNMREYTLTQKNKIKNVYGIVTTRDIKRVTIKGTKNIASVKNFTLSNIRVYGRSRYITIEDVLSQQDIPVQLTNDQIPTDCNNMFQLSVNLGIAIGEGDTFGVHMQETDRSNLVKNVLLKNVTSDGATIGFQTIFTYNFKVINCIATNNTYIGFLNGSGWILPTNDESNLIFPICGNGLFSKCQFQENNGLNFGLSNPNNSSFFNYLVCLANYGVSNIVIENCIFENNSNTGSISAMDNSTIQNIKCKNNTVSDIKSVYNVANGIQFGFLFENIPCQNNINYYNTNITVKNCTVTDIISDSFSSVGFYFGITQGGHISNCNVSGVIGATNSIGYYTTGGLTNNETSKLTFINNTAENNGSGIAVGIAVGFFIGYNANNIILKDNISNGNGTGFNIDYGIGILIQTFEIRSYNIDINNCTCNGNGNRIDLPSYSAGIAIINTDFVTESPNNIAIQKCTTKFNKGYGVLVSQFDNTPILGVTINETEIYQNALGGIVNETTTDLTTIFASRNTAYLNGERGNYVGIPLTTILEGTINNFPDNPGMKNISIVAP